MTGSKGSPTTSHWAGPLYLDASALVKLYLPEAGSDALDATLAGRRDLVVPDLALTEIVSALARRCREGSVSIDTAKRLRSAILRDLDEGAYLRIQLSPAAHREAERLLLSAGELPLRAADALHVSLALAAETTSLIAYDKFMRSAASHFGLTVLPPDDEPDLFGRAPGQ